jgi:hypothetical protein
MLKKTENLILKMRTTIRRVLRTLGDMIQLKMMNISLHLESRLKQVKLLPLGSLLEGLHNLRLL